ncbi:MAG: diguanylate cyclase [Gammaproteobacteria bacterium]
MVESKNNNLQLEDEDSWQRKYFDSVAALERRTQEADQAESVLREVAARICSVVDGAALGVEEHLSQLRRALRDGASLDSIEESVRELANRIVRRGRPRTTDEEPTPASVLLDVLAQVRLPSLSVSRAKALRKRLESWQPGVALQPLISELVDLVSEPAQPAGHPAPAEPAPRRPGFFGRRRRDDSGAPHAMAAGVLDLVIERLRHSGVSDKRLSALHQRLSQAADAKAVSQLAGELAAVLEGTVRASDRPQGVTGNEALQQLLERLDLPADVAGQSESLFERLEHDTDPAHWPGLLRDVADLIGAMRRKIQREKAEIEEFLNQLTSRLEVLDGHLREMDHDRSESLDSGRKLDAAVQEQVRGIHSSVASASELGELKQGVHQRLEAISEHMDQFRKVEEQRNEAAERRISELTERLQLLERESTQLRDQAGRERKLALFDPLTGTHNRMAYEERLQQEFERWKRFGEPLSLVIIDIDDFKQVNDGYGHKAGDKVLGTVGRLLRERLRATDFLARYGGEEFVILMPGADANAAHRVADELRASIEGCGFHYRNQPVAITVCCGVAEFRESDQPDAVFERADAALYLAKEEGKNRCLIRHPQ